MTNGRPRDNFALAEFILTQCICRVFTSLKASSPSYNSMLLAVIALLFSSERHFHWLRDEPNLKSPSASCGEGWVY